MFSIIIPTWNNLPYLQLSIKSIQQHSSLKHQLIIHVNEGSDGTLEWVKQNGLNYTFSAENVGVCVAVNSAAKLVQKDYVMFMNDDMYCLPGWDKALANEIASLSTDCFMLSATAIEPLNTRNKCVIVADYGRNPSDFEENRLLQEFQHFKMADWSGSTWPPNVVHKKWWDAVGGYSEEFSPGMSSDNDFAMKMWQQGCRIFKGCSSARVYHFISKSVGRVKKNDGRTQFLKKWRIKQSTFNKYYLRRGEPFKGILVQPLYSPGFVLSRLTGWLKMMLG